MTNTEPAYLLLGPELGKKEAFLTNLKETLKDRTGGSLEEFRFYPFESDAMEVLALVRNGSLFSSHTLVHILQADALSGNDRNQFIEYLKHPSENATVIFSTEEIKINKTFEAAFPKAGRHVFWELFENEKKSWITGFFKQTGHTIDSEAVELILDVVENNTQEMKRECERIILAAGEKTTIEIEDIENFLFHSKEETVFSLFAKMMEGKFVSSLEALGKILDSGEGSPVQLIGGLLWQFRKLLDLRGLLDEHYSFQEACDRLGIRGKKNQANYQAGVSKYTRRELEKILMALADFDATLRQVRSEMEPTLLEMLVYTCVVKKGSSEFIYSSDCTSKWA
ncbi:MAG: DNA polymerase III subunit delta [Spirochaetales bacterium]|nr:DNA polymerase III subunit delta [Spirochaetales bacterium]